MNMQRGGTFHPQSWQLITEVGMDRADGEEIKHRHFQKGINPGLCHPSVLLALTTGTHHLASPSGVKASLAEKPFKVEIPE